MKNLKALCTVFLILSFSCNEDEVIPRKSDEELIELTLEKISSNELVLEDAFRETSTTVTREAIQSTLKTSSSKAVFIANMNTLVEELFKNEVKSNTEQLATDVFIKFDGIKGESVNTTVSKFVLDQTSADPLVSYSNEVKSLLDARAASGRGALILIEKVIDEENSQSAPVEQVSLNVEKLKLMFELQNRVVTSAANGISAETDSEMESVLIQAGVPPVAVGLLLPAVQKIREYNGTSETAGSPYWDWLTDKVNPEINGGLNRDIIRRYNAAGFMGALQFLLSDEYKSDNQDLASMLLLRARYQASLMFIWSDIWEKSKLAAVMQTRVKNNEAILQAAFTETAKVITRKEILDARAASATKAVFISNMNALVDGIFEREVQKKSESLSGGVYVASGDVDGDGISSDLTELLIKNSLDPLAGHVKVIDGNVSSRSTVGNNSGDLDPRYVIVNNVFENGSDKKAFMSVTSEAILSATKFKDILVVGSMADQAMEQALEELRVQNQIPAPLMALLLPAVQKVREYNGTTETADTPYLQWLDSLDPMIKGGVNRDVIRRYDAAGFLGSLQFFVSDKYRNDNQDYASVLLLQTRYRASLLMLWNDLWDK